MSKKVLHIRLTTPFFKNGGISKGFIANGWEVFEFDWVKHKNALGAISMRANVVARAKYFKPDLIFIQCQTKGVFDVETIRALMEVAPTVLWNFDAREPAEFEWMYELGKHLTHLFVSNLNDVDEMAKRGQSNCSVMQSSCDHDEYRAVPKDETKKWPEIVFIGNKTTKFPLSAERTSMVAELTERYGDRFAAFGMGFQSGFFGVEKERECYSNAKAVIIHNQFGYEEYESDRLWRAWACGANCYHYHPIVDYSSMLDIEESNRGRLRDYFIEHHSYKQRLKKLEETLADVHGISFL